MLPAGAQTSSSIGRERYANQEPSEGDNFISAKRAQHEVAKSRDLLREQPSCQPGTLHVCMLRNWDGRVPLGYKKLHRSGVSAIPMQGLNVNGYAYGGLLLSRHL